MPYLGVLAALRSRLEGASPKYTPTLPDVTTMIDTNSLDAGAQRSTTDLIARLLPETTTRIGNVSVPIRFYGQEGNLTQLSYPLFTYNIVDTFPRFSNYLLPVSAERYILPMNDTKEALTDSSGTLLDPTPRAYLEHPLEEPVTFLAEIRLYTDNPVWKALMIAHLLKKFPMRYYIRVPAADGSTLSWDMFYETHRDLDSRRPVIADGSMNLREYGVSWTYKVEGYTDTLDQLVMKQFTRSVELDTETMEDT